MIISDKSRVRILFQFHSDLLNGEMTEMIWTTIVDQDKGFYKIDNIPFHAPLIATGDVVLAMFDDRKHVLTYRETITHSGNSVVRVLITDEDKDLNSIRYLFSELGCPSEKANDRYFTLEIPASVDYKIIKQKLDELEASGIIKYKEPCIADGHRL